MFLDPCFSESVTGRCFASLVCITFVGAQAAGVRPGEGIASSKEGDDATRFKV